MPSDIRDNLQLTTIINYMDIKFRHKWPLIFKDWVEDGHNQEKTGLAVTLTILISKVFVLSYVHITPVTLVTCFT